VERWASRTTGFIKDNSPWLLQNQVKKLPEFEIKKVANLFINMPDSIYARLKELPQRQHVSINQLVNTALDMEVYLNERARRDSKRAFRKALKKVPDVTPVKGNVA
jgi:hypothetical protein